MSNYLLWIASPDSAGSPLGRPWALPDACSELEKRLAAQTFRTDGPEWLPLTPRQADSGVFQAALGAFTTARNAAAAAAHDWQEQFDSPISRDEAEEADTPVSSPGQPLLPVKGRPDFSITPHTAPTAGRKRKLTLTPEDADGEREGKAAGLAPSPGFFFPFNIFKRMWTRDA